MRGISFWCVLIGLRVALLTPGVAFANNYNWYVRHTGGDDSASGTNWNQSWASLQKAWDAVALVMTPPDDASNAGGAEHSFDIHLQATGPGEVFTGAASDSSWWDTNVPGTIKRATVTIRGGYDPASGGRVGFSVITNSASRREGIYVNMHADHEQYLDLCLNDVAIRASGSAVLVMDARTPQVHASRALFFSASATLPTVDINGSAANYAYGRFSQSVFLGGGIGVSIRSGGYRYSTLCMTNCAVVGAALTGVRIHSYANPDTPTRVGMLRNVTISSIGEGQGSAILVEHASFDYHHPLQLDLDRVLVAHVGTNVVFNRAFDEPLVLNGSDNAFFGHAAFAGAIGAGTGTITNGLGGSLIETHGNPRLKGDGYHLHSLSPLANRYLLLPGDPAVDIDGDPRPLPAGAGRRGDIGCDEVPPLRGTVVSIQ